jgi:hypothetical protein
MTCKPITLASRYSEEIVERGATPNLDMFDLVNTLKNPADSYDQGTLLSTSLALNNALKRADTSKYPLVTDRKNQAPILYAEIADFLNESGLNIDSVNQTMTEFNSFISSESNADIDNTKDKRIKAFDVPSDVDNILAQLEFYYSENLANSISGGLCAAIANPFGKLLGALQALQFGGDLLDKLLNFSVADLLGPLDALKATLDKVVDSLKKTLEAQVKGIVDTAKATIKKIKAGAKKIMAKVKKMVDNVKEFLNGEGSLKDKIGEMISKASEQFKEITPSSIALLMFRFCQFSEMMQSFMKGPVDTLKTFVTGVAVEEQVVNIVSDARKQSAVNAGAVRISDEGAKATKERIAKAATAPAIQRDKELPPPEPVSEEYVTSGELTDDENALLMGLTADGIDGYFTFSANVKNMGKSVSDASDDAGWRMVNIEVWQKLMPVARRLEKTLVINSAYRSPQYNTRVGGAKGSMHKTGQAVDVSMAGFSDEEKRQFIRLASQEGFGGIAYYPDSNFMHVDIGSRRSWNKDHNLRRYIAMHEVDGFRKESSSGFTADA